MVTGNYICNNNDRYNLRLLPEAPLQHIESQLILYLYCFQNSIKWDVIFNEHLTEILVLMEIIVSIYYNTEDIISVRHSG